MFRPVLFALSLAATPAATAPAIDPRPPEGLTEADMAEVVDFIVGNTVFALMHQAGHMVIDRFALGMAGEAAADQFATLRLLDPRSGAGDQTLVDALDSWFLSSHQTASADPGDVVLPNGHSLNMARANAIVCQMVGRDAVGFSDIADAVSMPTDARRHCLATYEADVARWNAALGPHRVSTSGPRPAIAVAYDQPPATGVEGPVLRDNHVLEEVAGRLDDLALEPLTIRARMCGEPTTEWDPEKKELVLCYELVAHFASLIVEDITARK